MHLSDKIMKPYFKLKTTKIIAETSNIILNLFLFDFEIQISYLSSILTSKILEISIEINFDI